MFLFVLEFFFNLLLLGVLSLFSGLTWALCEGLLSSSAGFCFVFLWLYLCVCVLFCVLVVIPVCLCTVLCSCGYTCVFVYCFVFLWLYLCVCVLFKVSLLWLCYLKDTTLTRNVVTMYNVE